MIDVKIILDSINEEGNRLITLEMTYPLMVHQHILTHRDFSRNTSSMRAVPRDLIINSVLENPYIPTNFPKNGKGMEVKSNLDNYDECVAQWLKARDSAVEQAKEMINLGIHKEVANRLLYAWAHTTVVLSSTEFLNFFKLRLASDTQEATRELAKAMYSAIGSNKPTKLKPKEWHLPYVTDEEKLAYGDNSKLISAGRCGGVSYLRQGMVFTPEKAISLAKSFIESGHPSPLEHQAFAEKGRHGNFNGWKQLRQEIGI